MKMNIRFLIVYCLLILAGLYVNLHADVEVPLNKPFKEFPADHNGWHMTSDSRFSDDVFNALRATDYMNREYVGPEGLPVHLYIGYHGGGKDSGAIHSPKHCLPGSGWYPVSEEKIKLRSGQNDIDLVKAVYQKGAYRQLFLYWYDVKGESLSNEFALKFAEIKNSMFYRRRDSSFIRVSVSISSDENASFIAGEKLVKDFYPLIMEYLPN